MQLSDNQRYFLLVIHFLLTMVILGGISHSTSDPKTESCHCPPCDNANNIQRLYGHCMLEVIDCYTCISKEHLHTDQYPEYKETRCESCYDSIQCLGITTWNNMIENIKDPTKMNINTLHTYIVNKNSKEDHELL